MRRKSRAGTFGVPDFLPPDVYPFGGLQRADKGLYPSYLSAPASYRGAVSAHHQRQGAFRRNARAFPFHVHHVQNMPGEPVTHEQGNNLQVIVRDNNVDQALRALKKKLQREGVFREMKARRSYEKPSEKRAREKAEAVRRTRKMARKLAQREGLLPAPKKKLPLRGRPRPAAAAETSAA